MAKKTEIVWNDLEHTKSTPGTEQFKSPENRRHMIYVPKEELAKLAGEGDVVVTITRKAD